MKKVKIRWGLWAEALLFVVAVFILYSIFENADPIAKSIRNFLGVISPFLIGSAIAYFLNVPCNLVEKRIQKSGVPFFAKRARLFSVFAVYIVVLGIIAILMSVIIPTIVQNMIDFFRFIPTLYTNVYNWLLDLDLSMLNEFFNVEETIRGFFEGFSIQDVLAHITTGLGSLGEFSFGFTRSLVNVVIAFIISIYTLIYKDGVVRTLNRTGKAFMKEKAFSLIKEYLVETDGIFYKFIASRVINSFITGILATIILLIIGVPFAIALGFFIGVCNMIPYFGSIVSTVVAGVVTIFTGGMMLALVATMALFGLQIIDGNIIGPKLMGDAVNLNPILIIFSITIGGVYFGVLGMFLAVPLAALLKIIFHEVIEARERKMAEKVG